MEALLSPPGSVRGVTLLDKEMFKKTVPVIGIIASNKIIGNLMKKLKKHILSIRNMKAVREYDSDKRIILLDPTQYASVDSAKSIFVDTDELSQNVEFITYELELGYDNWSAEEVLKSVLPTDIPAVTGFSVVGHVAHLNLKETHAPYKSVIGEVLLDKHMNLQSVVNKTDNIDNTYRNFAMELVAGKDDMNVTVKENGCTFQFDFSKVYWNSRLGTEHERIISSITPDTVLYDVFAGVGPFAVPAAKKLATVYCNDLNPHSYKFLSRNLIANKVKGEYKSYNMDGRQFIKDIVKPSIISHLGDNKPLVVVMNLPALAIEFLDTFVGLLQDVDLSTITRCPINVHCYCFSNVADKDYEQDVAQRISKVLNLKTEHILPKHCRRVRNVAPNKEMLCAEFPLMWDIMMCKETDDEPTRSKKPKIDQP